MPQREYHFYVYILASRSRSLYVGFTNDIRLRIRQHREKSLGTHTAKYNIGRLVYYENFTYVLNAIAREKELKDWNRAKKIALIEQNNPTWEDLAAGDGSGLRLPPGRGGPRSHQEQDRSSPFLFAIPAAKRRNLLLLEGLPLITCLNPPSNNHLQISS